MMRHYKLIQALYKLETAISALILGEKLRTLKFIKASGDNKRRIYFVVNSHSLCRLQATPGG
jgi:hypothetical protein